MKKRIQKSWFFCCFFTLILMSGPSAFAETPNDLVKSFIAAYEAAHQPKATDKDLDHYFSFMSDDIVDEHVAYRVISKGKDKPRKNLKAYALRTVSWTETIESIILGSETAVVAVITDSKYYKNDKLKHFVGRTLWVLEFNEQGLINYIRRYQD